MQTILPPSGNTIKILGKARSAEHGLRWMHYVLAQPVEGGVRGLRWFWHKRSKISRSRSLISCSRQTVSAVCPTRFSLPCKGR